MWRNEGWTYNFGENDMTDKDLQGTHTRSEVLERAWEMSQHYYQKAQVEQDDREKLKLEAQYHALSELIRHYEGE